MRKKFNDAGLCVPGRHYMVDISDKIGQIMRFVEDGEYLTINRPRQFGKTTTMSLLAKQLGETDNYVALKISFEELDPDSYRKQETFIYEVLMMLLARLEFLNLGEAARLVEKSLGKATNVPALSRLITKLVRDMLPGKSVVLLIDEVDKSSNNQLFMTFLGMLRNKYLLRNEGQDYTFQSVILAGVHDVKTLKAKIRPDDARRYNSPWNIAVDFKVDMSFSPREIETMLLDYSREKQIEPDIPAIAEKLHYYTSGYPWLVSKLCKFIDEDIAPMREGDKWFVSDVEAAFGKISDGGYTSTLFDSLAKNLENSPELYELIFHVVINGEVFPFNISDPVTNLAHLYGILVRAERGGCKVHNRIFEQRIYDYMMSRLLREKHPDLNIYRRPEFYTDDGLDIELILERFQAFMKEHYSEKDVKFLEREGRLLFLSYLRPIINGRGFDFKEPMCPKNGAWISSAPVGPNGT